jgi:hypothetical protein
MNSHPPESDSSLEILLWESAEGLFSPDPDTRENSLDRLFETEGYFRSPLIAALLITRIDEPILELRYHLIRQLGNLVDLNSQGRIFTDQALVFAKEGLDQLSENQIKKILEVSDQYLAAEEAVSNIFKLSSYAGVGLSGIVNDRKQPISLRQQAIFFCGEIGILTSRPALQNLIQRVERSRNRIGAASERKKDRDDELLYPYAVSALEKLNC